MPPTMPVAATVKMAEPNKSCLIVTRFPRENLLSLEVSARGPGNYTIYQCKHISGFIHGPKFAVKNNQTMIPSLALVAVAAQPIALQTVEVVKADRTIAHTFRLGQTVRDRLTVKVGGEEVVLVLAPAHTACGKVAEFKAGDKLNVSGLGSAKVIHLRRDQVKFSR